jgi:hypothetical protein
MLRSKILGSTALRKRLCWRSWTTHCFLLQFVSIESKVACYPVPICRAPARLIAIFRNLKLLTVFASSWTKIEVGHLSHWHSYCWWKKSCTTLDGWNPINNGINHLSTGVGFLPSTVALLKHTETLSFRQFPILPGSPWQCTNRYKKVEIWLACGPFLPIYFGHFTLTPSRKSHGERRSWDGRIQMWQVKDAANAVTSGWFMTMIYEWVNEFRPLDLKGQKRPVAFQPKGTGSTKTTPCQNDTEEMTFPPFMAGTWPVEPNHPAAWKTFSPNEAFPVDRRWGFWTRPKQTIQTAGTREIIHSWLVKPWFPADFGFKPSDLGQPKNRSTTLVMWMGWIGNPWGWAKTYDFSCKKSGNEDPETYDVSQ